jgi:hypothetical protein
MIMINYWVQIDEDNYTTMKGEVEWLEQNLGWRLKDRIRWPEGEEGGMGAF